jgi:N-acetylglucosamine-6-phosphate deacetylase
MKSITAHAPLLGGGTVEIAFANGRIARVAPSAQVSDLCIGPTLFDIQVNGYGGQTCKIRRPQKSDVLAYITRLFRENGVGWWIPTVCTDTFDVLESVFRRLGSILDEDGDVAASVPGFHLEGPYLSAEDGPRGVHERQAIRPPDWDEFQRLQEACAGRIRYVTLAPEQAGAAAFTRRAVQSGVVVSMGHSAMRREDLAHLVEAGATMSTHLGNGAHDMIQRHNNYLWYQLACRRTYASFISDGQHLPQECFYSMLHAKGLELSLITSDCVSLGGLPPGRYGSVEKLPSGRLCAVGTTNLSGSSSHLRECLECAIRMGGLSHAEGWRLASTQPAQALGLSDRLGLEPGKEASFTLYRYHEEGPRIEVRQTWVAGRKVFDADTTPLTPIRLTELEDWEL